MYRTITEAIVEETRVTAYCHTARCEHSALLDLVTISRRFGPAFECSGRNFNPRLRCTICRCKNASVRFAQLETYDRDRWREKQRADGSDAAYWARRFAELDAMIASFREPPPPEAPQNVVILRPRSPTDRRF